MQCVILAAGRGTRMMELTSSVPKPMLDVAGKPLLEYKLAALPEEIDEVVIVVGYLKDVVQKHFGATRAGKRITYVEQKNLDGTAGALWSAQTVLKDRFIVMMGDDIYAKEDIARCIAPYSGWRLLVQEITEMHRSGSVEVGEDGLISRIVEGDRSKDKGIASTNLYTLDMRLFTAPLIPKQEGSLEYGLPQTVVAASKTLGIPFEPVFTDKWVQVTSPKDLVHAAEMLKRMTF